MTSVLITDRISSSAADIFRARGIEVGVTPTLPPHELGALIGKYEGLAIRSATVVTDKIMAAGKKLRVVGRAGSGVDNIDLVAARNHGVVVMRTPSANSTTAAEHAIALMFALARHIPAADRSTHGGKWEKSRFMGVELAGKTLGIIGCGRVGSVVADRALGLRMRPLVYDPALSRKRARALGVEIVPLDVLLARSDFVSIHVPLTDITRGMIDASALEKMKPSVRIVNCARGGLIVEADLRAAIEAKRVAGAALDVFAEEPPMSSALLDMEEVIATPHIGASTVEAQERAAVQLATQMAEFLESGTRG